MLGSSVSALLLAVALAAPFPQASSSSSPTLDQQPSNPNPGNTTALVPQQLRKAQPPPANASADQLEAMGDSLREQKAYADSLDYYRAAMKKSDSAVLHDKAGIAELELLHHDDARREFERATKMDKHYAEAFNNLGVIAYIHKKYGRAIKYYKKAIELRDSSASFYSNLGTAYFAEKHFEDAIGEYARALQLDPDIFERHQRAGVSLHLATAEDRAHYDYVLAKMYAGVNNAERCLLYLRKAMEEGYPQIGDVFKDNAFDRIRKDPRFVSLMSQRPVAIPEPNPNQ